MLDLDGNIDIEIPDKLIPLFDGPADFRGISGGRGGAKTLTVAKVLAYYGASKKLRILCAREIQLTIQESVFYELKNAIESCPFLSQEYEIGRSYIRSNIGTEFLFKGLRHNISEIKGLGQIDYVWIDEAESVSDDSWNELIPTIRKENSEIWATWNPKSPDSKVQKIFSSDQIQDDESGTKSIVKHVTINWRDNPWFPEKLNRERLRCLEQDSEEIYNHVWEGAFLIVSGRTVFDKKHMQKAAKECYKQVKRMALEGKRFVEHSAGELRLWQEPKHGYHYVIGADVAEGLEKGDYSCADVICIESGLQVAQWHGHIAPDLFAKVLIALGYWYSKATITCEANNHGILTNTILRDSNYPNVYIQKSLEDKGSDEKETRRVGFLTTSRAKSLIIDQLASVLRENESGIVCAETINEMMTYIVEENGSYNAAPKCFDDRVMSYALANHTLLTHHLYKRLSKKHVQKTK